MATLDELVVRIRADATQLEREMRRATGATQDAGRKMGGSLTSLAGQFKSLVPALAIGSILEFGRRAVDSAGHITDLAMQVGFATSTLSALESGLAANGATLDDFTSSVNLMNNALGEAAKGGQAQVEAFDALGLSVRKLQQMTPEEQFYEIVSALAQVDEQYRQTEIGRSIFGRGFSRLLPLLKESKGDLQGLVEEQKRLGEGLNDETLKRIDDFGDKLSEAAIKAKNTFLEAFAVILPGLEKLMEGVGFIVNLPDNAFKAGQEIGKQLNPYNQWMEKSKANGFVTEATFAGAGGEAFGPAFPKKSAKGSNAGLIKGKSEEKQKETEDYDSVNDAMADYLAGLENERELAGLSGRALDERRAILEASAIATKNNTLLSPEMQAQILREVDATHDLKDAQEQLKKSQDEAAESAREWRQKMTDGLTDIVLHFDSASNAAKRFFEEIAGNILRQKVTGPLSEGIMGMIGGSGGGLLGSLFGGGSSSAGQVASSGPTLPWHSGAGAGTGISFFADGGDPPVGVPSVVGERGPELFVPRTAGTVIPNHALGGQSINISHVWNISPGIQGTVRAELMQAIPGIVAASKNAVIEAVQKGGGESKSIRG